MRAIRTTLLMAAASGLALSAGLAQAADVPTADPVSVEEIVVTAQKREQKTLDVPIALTAYTGSRLEKMGVTDFATLSAFVPGFLVQDQSPNNPGFMMRGLTSDSTDPTVEPRVSVFQDGVSISKATGSYVELFDVERVEVAKGPQSTLFGRGALIGGVNIIQNKADPSGVHAALKAEAGDYGQRMYEGMVNVPLAEGLAVRVALRSKQRDGYVDNALGGDAFQSQDTFAGRFALHGDLGEAVTADLIYNYQHDTPTGTAFKSGGFSPTNPATGQVLASRDPQAAAALASPAGFVGGPLGVDRTVEGLTGIVSWKLGDAFRLTSTSAFRTFDSSETYDPDGLSLPILTGLNRGQGDQTSQEFRLNYDNGGRLTWFAGAGYFGEKGSQQTPLQFDERMGLAVLTGQLNAGAAGSGLPSSTPAPAAYFNNTAFTGALMQGLVAALSGNRVILSNAQAQAIAANLRPNEQETARLESELKSYDLFADATYRLTDKLEITAGVRYTTDDKTSGFSSSTIGGRSVLGGAIGAAQLAASGTPTALAQANAILGALASPAVQSFPASALPNFGLTFQPTANNGDWTYVDHSDSGVTWRLVGRYSFSDAANVYASYARGRRPEVLATSGPSAPYGPARFGVVDAETVDSYEVGAKGQFLDNRLRLDGAVFYYDYSNFQTIEQRGTLFVTVNAGKAKAYGFEGQADWAASSFLDLYATYAYNHARFDGGAYDGNHFRLSPDSAASFGASLHFDALGGRFDFRPTYTWRSKIFFDDNNDLAKFQQPPSVFVADNLQNEFQDAYGLLNMRLSYQPAGKPVTLEAFVNNVTDEKYIIDAGNTGDSLGLPTFIAGAPRMWGVSLSWKY
jgi:outer membrane receptor protein involved in Fe transport